MAKSSDVLTTSTQQAISAVFQSAVAIFLGSTSLNNALSGNQHKITRTHFRRAWKAMRWRRGDVGKSALATK